MRCLSPGELTLVNQLLSQHHFRNISAHDTVQVGSRLVLDDGAQSQCTTYFSTKYKRVKVRNSFTVRYSEGFGQVSAFIAIDGLDCVVVLLEKLVQTSTCQNQFRIGHDALDNLPSSELVPVAHGPPMCVLSTSLKGKCVFVNAGSSGLFVISFPFSLLYD